jgi:hypothetical protein
VLYYHPGPGPSEDLDWARAAGISPVDDGKNFRVMLSMYREIGERYGNRPAGWCIDGGDAYYWRNFPFRELTVDLEAGNPSRVVSNFQWLFPMFSRHTQATSSQTSSTSARQGFNKTSEAFNVFNHPALGIPDHDVADFGTGFGSVSGAANSQRQLQLSGKIVF